LDYTTHREKGPLVRASSLIALAIFLCWLSISQAADFSGPVVSVLDGDTIEVLHNQRPERIRLSDIDCPEKGQAFGKQAMHAASELLYGKEVTFQTFGKDKYGRTLADVFLPDGTYVNHELVKDGWRWWFRKYAPGSTTLERLEVEAREVRIPGVLRKARVPTRWDAT
jgi:endonuclease YncB( thermonuclease family)